MLARGIGVPNIQARTTGAGTQRQVLLALSVALVINVAASAKRVPGKSNKTPNPFEGFFKLGSGALWGTGILFVTLIILSDFPTTEDLAKAFAFLILLASLMKNGEDAFQQFVKLTQTDWQKELDNGQ